MSRYWVRLAELLGVNSIPIVGVLAGQWSPATALSAYWIESLLASIFTATRLFLYARWSDSATHPVVAEGSSFALRRPGPFRAMTIPFTLAHAVRLAAVFAAVLHMPRQNGESFDEYWRRTNLPAGTGPAAKAPRPQWRVKMKRR